MNVLIETRFKIEEMMQAAALLLAETKNIAEDVNYSYMQDKENKQLGELYFNCCSARAMLTKYSSYLDSIKNRLAGLED